ncbi:protein-tyrosine phosphatase-like protein [Coniella lustricola]|uniref:Protein-tyrosine phosphatase-like protein n=1 Tax=Coniella lustricola TaxID=2025994 RepID=A0A2T3AED3_9PEZI|nr:protein-tyrosine phosphatase-like protein [Coniella lustricola]
MSDSPPPSPPFIDIPGLPNFRDAGGYPLAADPAKMVRRGLIFRSSEPSKVTDAGTAMMTHDLAIRVVYDLRSQTEIDRDATAASASRQVKEWAGAQRVFVPVFTHEDYSPEAIARRYSAFAREGSTGFAEVYRHILVTAASKQGAQPFATILRHLASSSAAPSPILIHCTAGKDRTGVIVALLLSLCGVADEVVAHEYALTDLGLQARRAEFIAQLVAQPPLQGKPAEAERMVSSRKENMLATLALVREEWGGVEEYVVKELGLSIEEVIAIRRNLVVDVGVNGDDGVQKAAVAWTQHARLLL